MKRKRVLAYKFECACVAKYSLVMSLCWPGPDGHFHKAFATICNQKSSDLDLDWLIDYIDSPIGDTLYSI